MDQYTGKNMESRGRLNVASFRQKLVSAQYPALYGHLTGIGGLLGELGKTKAQMVGLQCLHLNISSALEDLFLKEEEIIFPLLLRLEQSGEKAQHCHPFKTVKQYFIFLVATVQQFKLQLTQLTEQWNEIEPLCTLKEYVRDFEASLIRMQNHKEQLLFKPFRRCNNNCKVL